MRPGFYACWLFVSLLFCTNQRQEGDPYSLQTVRMALGNNSIGLIFGGDENHIPRLGDACAIAILKIVGEPNLTDPKTVKAILLTINSAFFSPQRIAIAEDRNPRVTLFLLKYLKQNVRDAELQQDVLKTMKFVETQTAQFTMAGASHDR